MLCNTMCDTERWKHRVTLSIPCPLQMDVNKMFGHLIQLQRKPEPKEVDITYGKKMKDISCRVKTAREDWKEREASTTQTVPTRIKIFEGGSVKILVIVTLVSSADSSYIRRLLHSPSVRLPLACVCSPQCCLCLSGTSPMKTTCTSEVEAGGNTFVRSVGFAVRSRAC